MYYLNINENSIRDYIKSLITPDEYKSILNTLVCKYDRTYTHLLYSIFNVYLKSYIQITDENSCLSKTETLEIVNKFNVYVKGVDVNQILVVDKLDLIYNAFNQDPFDRYKFNSYFYDDIFNKLENMLGVEKTTDCLCEIFDILENIVNFIESNLIKISTSTPETDEESNIHLYVDIKSDNFVILFF